MSFIRIEQLIPTPGREPEQGHDPVSSVPCTRWAPQCQARFSFTLPERYRPGYDLKLIMLESTPATGKRHAWEVASLLLRPDLHATHEAQVTETKTLEFLGAPLPYQLTTRALNLTGATRPGCVAELPMQPGDMLAITLTRVPAAMDEDPFPIALWSLHVDAALDQLAVSPCPGRTGRIIDTVRDLFNESAHGFLSDAFILRAMNRCLEELAQEQYWQTETWIPAQAGVYRMDMLDMIPHIQALHRVWFGAPAAPLTRLERFTQFDEARAAGPATGRPQFFFFEHTILWVWPPPVVDNAAGFRLYYSYAPDRLTGAPGAPDLPIPSAHDMLFVYFVLMHAFLRDRHAAGADAKFHEYAALYERQKQKLLAESAAPRLSIYPARR